MVQTDGDGRTPDGRTPDERTDAHQKFEASCTKALRAIIYKYNSSPQFVLQSFGDILNFCDTVRKRSLSGKLAESISDTTAAALN